MRRPPPHQQITQKKYAEQTAKEEQFKRMFCRSKMLKINKSTKQPTVLIKSSNTDSSLAKALSTSTTPASSSSSALASAPVVTFSSSASSTSSSVINNHSTIPANFEILMETKDFKDNYKQQQVAVNAVDASYAALPQSQTQGRCVAAALDSCNLSEDSFSFCFISALLGLH